MSLIYAFLAAPGIGMPCATDFFVSLIGSCVTHLCIYILKQPSSMVFLKWSVVKLALRNLTAETAFTAAPGSPVIMSGPPWCKPYKAF